VVISKKSGNKRLSNSQTIEEARNFGANLISDLEIDIFRFWQH